MTVGQESRQEVRTLRVSKILSFFCQKTGILGTMKMTTVLSLSKIERLDLSPPMFLYSERKLLNKWRFLPKLAIFQFYAQNKKKFHRIQLPKNWFVE